MSVVRYKVLKKEFPMSEKKYELSEGVYAFESTFFEKV